MADGRVDEAGNGVPDDDDPCLQCMRDDIGQIVYLLAELEFKQEHGVVEPTLTDGSSAIGDEALNTLIECQENLPLLKLALLHCHIPIISLDQVEPQSLQGMCPVCLTEFSTFAKTHKVRVTKCSLKGHVFCSGCLEEYVKSDWDMKLPESVVENIWRGLESIEPPASPKCPVCREELWPTNGDCSCPRRAGGDN